MSPGQHLAGLLVFLSVCVLTIVSSSPWEGRKIRNHEGSGTKYMSQHCREIFWDIIMDNAYVFIDNQTFLMAQPMTEIELSNKYIHHDQCVTTLAAPPRHKLLLHFLDVAINYRQEYKSRLHVFDGFNRNTQISLSPNNGLYGETQSSDSVNNIVMKDYVSTGQALTLVFSGYLSKRFFGFKAIVTPIKRPFRNGTCPYHLFQCRISKFCIDIHLTCNGLPNCGETDNSDESSAQCNAKLAPLTDSTMDDLGLMIGCGVSVLVLVMALIWVGVMCQKRQRLRRQRQQLSWQDRRDSPSEPDNSRWLPRVLHDHLSPWMLREPPPSYTDSIQTDDVVADLNRPPPYAPMSGEQRSLIWKQHDQVVGPTDPVNNQLGKHSHIIANPGAIPISSRELPPSYEEGDIPHLDRYSESTTQEQLVPSAPSLGNSRQDLANTMINMSSGHHQVCASGRSDEKNA